jgi:hypothetical protein
MRAIPRRPALPPACVGSDATGTDVPSSIRKIQPSVVVQ